MEEVLIRSISEASTYYTNDDLLNNGDYNSIYSPRIDLSFSPCIKKKRAKDESIGVYRLSEDVHLFDLVHNLDFIKNIESSLRKESNKIMRANNLSECNLGIEDYVRGHYPNDRPLHLFGIEIENQMNSKHLMGDFLNAINLSLIPIVVIPESKLDNLLNMLKYNKHIMKRKGISTYDTLKKVIVLRVSDFRDALNYILQNEGLDVIGVEDYR